MAKTSKTGRSSSSGQFIVGERAFTSISAVEGIMPSERLKSDLRKLKSSSSDKRRAVLAETYGNKK